MVTLRKLWEQARRLWERAMAYCGRQVEDNAKAREDGWPS